MAKICIIVPIFLLALYVNSGEAVRCWICSSELNPYCNDPFLPERAPENSGLFRLEYCDANAGASYPYLASSVAVCKKQKKIIGNQMIVSRGCTWKRGDDYSNACASSSSSSNELTTFCETCTTDACNGGSAIGITLAAIMAPLGVLLFK